jgi:hypothetical protein
VYTLIRDPDGTVTLRTHVDLDELPAAEARRLLLALRPLLDVLRERVRADRLVATEFVEAGARAPRSRAFAPVQPELVPVG